MKIWKSGMTVNHEFWVDYCEKCLSCGAQFFGRLISEALKAITIIVMLSAASFAQLIIPVDKKMPTPNGFDFQGTWKCGDGSDSAYLQVGLNRRQYWHRKHREYRQTLHWTQLKEKDSDFTGHFFVAYDRDKQQFVMIDADDPAYSAFTVERWTETTVILSSVTALKSFGWDFRWIYEFEGPDKFRVSLEEKDGSTWQPRTACECRRISHHW